jgi:hypothetical protein
MLTGESGSIWQQTHNPLLRASSFLGLRVYRSNHLLHALRQFLSSRSSKAVVDGLSGLRVATLPFLRRRLWG